MFTETEARSLVGRRIHLGLDPAPACDVARVIGAEQGGDGWELLVQGLVRGAPAVVRCNREEWDRFAVGRA